MKFKKVEIQAFRAYDLIEEGTFDFLRKDKKNADFVSIYAPNGFGKTSFYDAVEWGFTRNIDRFVKRGKKNLQVIKSEKNLNEDAPSYFLRNKQSDEGLVTKVVLHTTDLNEPEITTTLPKARKGQYDYKFGEEAGVRNYFREVILSQEWIDSFLKEESGSERYQTFMKLFGDHELDQYYKNLLALKKTNDANCLTLEKDINGLQLDLVFDGDIEVLKVSNDIIQEIKEESLPPIRADFNETELGIYSAKLTTNIHKQQLLIDETQLRLNQLENALTGGEMVMSLRAYLKQIDQLVLNKRHYQEVNSKIQQFDSISKMEETLTKLRQDMETHSTQRSSLENLIVKFPEYQTNALEIIMHRENLEYLRFKEKEKRTDIDANIEKQTQMKSEQKSYQDVLNISLMALENIPNLTKKIAESEKELKIIKLLHVLSEEKLKKLTDEAEIKNALIAKIHRTIDYVSHNVIEFEPDQSFDHLQGELTSLKILLANRIEALKDLQSITMRHTRQKDFNEDLQQLIAKGMKIINGSKTSNCPLCNQDYASFEMLSDKIISNQDISEIDRILVTEKNEVDLRIGDISKRIEEQKRKLTRLLQKIVEDEQGLLRNLITQASEEAALLKSLADKLITLEQVRSNLVSALENRTLDEYKVQLTSKIDNTKRIIEGIRGQLEALEKLHGDLMVEMAVLAKQIENSVSAEELCITNASYMALQSFFKSRIAKENEEPNQLTIENLLRITLDSIRINLTEQQRISEDIALIHEALIAYNKSKLLDEFLTLDLTINLAEQELNQFRDFIRSNFSWEIISLEPENIHKLFQEERARIQNRLNEQKKIVHRFQLLEKLKEGLLPYLKYEQAKEQGERKRNRLKLLKGKIKKEIEKERKLVAAHIDQQINSFFYEDVINSLYRRIDPHPEYKTIKFKCDFTDDKPQLNVCFFEKNTEKLLIPNLYFSTAQLNILSLSIFLAKALHAENDRKEPLQCIFIDDPIQSMDSINILSTIDLLRSIIVNGNRQIILSTHDANFHNLLMKKIPETLFLSKFMELETFGKVKTELIS